MSNRQNGNSNDEDFADEEVLFDHDEEVKFEEEDELFFDDDDMVIEDDNGFSFDEDEVVMEDDEEFSFNEDEEIILEGDEDSFGEEGGLVFEDDEMVIEDDEDMNLDDGVVFTEEEDISSPKPPPGPPGPPPNVSARNRKNRDSTAEVEPLGEEVFSEEAQTRDAHIQEATVELSESVLMDVTSRLKESGADKDQIRAAAEELAAKEQKEKSSKPKATGDVPLHTPAAATGSHTGPASQHTTPPERKQAKKKKRSMSTADKQLLSVLILLIIALLGALTTIAALLGLFENGSLDFSRIGIEPAAEQTAPESPTGQPSSETPKTPPHEAPTTTDKESGANTQE